MADIPFEEVAATWRLPAAKTEIVAVRALNNQNRPYRCLIFGQMFATGSATANTMMRVTRASQGAAYFGAGSMLAEMVEKWLKTNDVTEVYAFGLADNVAGIAATGAFAFAGTATESRTLNLYIGGRRIQLAVTTGMTAAVAATAVAAAINADGNLAVTAAVDGVDTGKVNVTARHKGEAYNELDLRHSHYEGEDLAAGITCAITAMAGGDGNPDVTPVIAAMAGTQYHIIAGPYADAANLTLLRDELQDRWGAMWAQEGNLITAKRASHSATGAFGDTWNSYALTIMPAHGLPESPWQLAAATAAAVAYHANIRPQQQFNTNPLPMMAPKREDRWLDTERNLLLYDGISAWTVDDGGVVRLQRLITTYKKTASGADDDAWLDLNTALTLSYLRWDWNTYMAAKYPNFLLADDSDIYELDVTDDMVLMTPSLATTEIRDWALLKAGQLMIEDPRPKLDQFFAQRNSADRDRIDINAPLNIINNARYIATRFGFER